MTTEEQIIYTIHDIVRAGTINQDDPINERLLRSFLSIHRGNQINRFSFGGQQIPDECYQNIGPLVFQKYKNFYRSTTTLPKHITFKYNFGIKLMKGSKSIPVLNSGEFYNSQNDTYNKFQPMAMIESSRLLMSIGSENNCCVEDLSATAHNLMVKKLKAESNINNITLDGQAVLVNPDDENGYDFTASAYPFPDELIEDLMNSVQAREFGIFLRTKSDEIGDKKDSTSEYNTREEL